MNIKGTRARAVAGIGAMAAVVSVYAFVQTTTEQRYRCWDGSLEANTRDCSTPHARPGLFWLFPSLASASGCELTVPIKSRKTAVYVCNLNASQDRYLIRYTAWTDTESAADYYDEQYAGEPTALVLGDQRVGDEWMTSDHRPEQGMPFKMSGAFYALPFSWSVEASSEPALERARHSELVIREVDHWNYDRELGFWARLGHGLSP